MSTKNVDDIIQPSTVDSPGDSVDAISKRQQQLQVRNSIHPSFFAKLFVNHTKKTCTITCLIPVFAIIIIIATRALSIDSPEGREYYVRNDILTRLNDGRDAARDEYPFNDAEENTADRRQTDYDGSLAISILMRGKNSGTDELASVSDNENSENVLTRESIALHKKAEDLIINHKNYSLFCLRDPGKIFDCDGNEIDCQFPDSYLNHPNLYGVFSNERLCGRQPGHDLVSEDNFNKFLNSMFSSDDQFKLKNYFDDDLDDVSKKAWAMKSSIPIGLPLAGYKSSKEQVSEQDEEYIKWTDESVKNMNEELSTSSYDVYPISSLLVSNVFGSVVFRDLAFSVVAIFLVFLVIWLHTSSMFLAGSAMLQIFLSFPITFLIYHFVCRQLYFAALQILTIFLLLGIGADDVFVFTDAWKQASVVLGSDVDLLTRMTWTYRRAVRAMTVTSLTTAAAFFVTASSPIMPIATLGIWAGILILLQFLLVISMYPCATVIWHRFWRPRLAIKCFKKIEPEENIEKEVNTPIWHRLLPMRKRPEPRDVDEYRLIERFFRGPWFNLILKLKFFLIVISFGCACVAIWRATTLEPPADTEAFLPDDNPVRVAASTLRDAFPRSDSDLLLRVRFVWGLEDVDRTGTSKFEVKERGKPVFDDDFDLKKKEVQQQIYDACQYVEDRREGLLFNLDTGIESIRCWIRDYLDWRTNEEGKSEFETFENDKLLAENLIKFGEFERGEGINKTKPYIQYLRRQEILFNTERDKVLTTEVLFVSDKEATLPEKIMWPEYLKWKKIMDDLNANQSAPVGGNKGTVTGGETWLYSVTQRTLQRTMITGIGIMLVVALFTLIAATLNWLVAILATISIGGVIAMLLGAIRLYGWSLGISESIGVVIGVGYSFDGVAHVATAYVESKSKTRMDRTRDALTDLGISVLFGAVTTLLAGFCLLPAIIIFFKKFAGLILTTITLSLLWSLVFFPALLVTIGPQDNFGSLGYLFSKCFPKKENTTPPKTIDDDSPVISEKIAGV